MFSSNTSAVASAANYIEDVFSTYLYTGTGANQTITNEIDLATKGGLVWQKCRSTTKYHVLTDTVRGAGYGLYSNTTDAQDYAANRVPAFNTNGFDTGANSEINSSGATFVSWTFRKQPKFFDVVTWSGNGTIGRTISHSLGSEPGCIIVKKTNTTGASDWVVYHRSLGATKAMILNLTDSVYTWSVWNDTAPTSTVFSLNDASEVNGVGNTYVAYLFAHDAGGFGLTGTDNVISCGSYTGNGSSTGPVIDLGFEPQWILQKEASNTGNWHILDVMRGMPVTGNTNLLLANTSAAEYTNLGLFIKPTATGFQIVTTDNDFNTNGSTHIYIAIRRGPMKVPTSGTSVFSPNTANASAGTPVVTNFPVDLSISVATAGDTRYFSDRLRGVNSTGQTANQPWIASNSSAAELTNASIPRGWDNTQILVPPYYAGGPVVWWNMRRAPSFFDEVCWTGTGSGSQAITHNLGVAPEFTITKRRGGTGNWSCFPVMFGVNTSIYLDSTAALQTNAAFHPTLPTATTYYTDDASSGVENIGGTFVTYLFATCAGVSKVGSYTGTGTTLQVNCGFTGGARFVLIKRTDSTGDWYVWDSARGIVAGNDPYLLLNLTAAEVTNTDYVDTYSAGFEISSTAPAAINASGGTFIFLAIA